MGFSHRILASVCLAVLTSGCATVGTNIEGDFTCRAPKGDCAPSEMIDARATKDLSASGPVHDGLRPPVSCFALLRNGSMSAGLALPARRLRKSDAVSTTPIFWAIRSWSRAGRS